MQLEQMMKMGGMESIMGMMPGMGKMAKQAAAAGMDDKVFKQQIALIQSMTKKERANPQILQASRKNRIAKGAGMEVSELNKLLKMQRQMGDMMKKMGKGGMLKQAMKGMFGKGGWHARRYGPVADGPQSTGGGGQADGQPKAACPADCRVLAAVQAYPRALADLGKRNDHGPHPHHRAADFAPS